MARRKSDRSTKRGSPHPPASTEGVPMSPGEFRLPNSATRRQIFARNLDRLLALTGLSRKDAAEKIRVPYPLIRRFVTVGISRNDDDRNAEYLHQFVRYFGLADTESLWRADLLERLFTSSEGRGFVEEFRPMLETKRREWLEKLAEVDRDLLKLVSKALGLSTDDSGQFEEDLAKVRTILGSSRAAQFRQMIDDYLNLATGRKSVKDIEG